MTRVVEKPGTPTRVEASVSPAKHGTTIVGLSVSVRAARIGYAMLSSVFVVCVLVQVFFAGMGAFGADWSLHLALARFLGLPPLLMAPMAFIGRLSWGLRLLPPGLMVLIGLQYAFADAAVPAAALHPVNAFLILFLSLLIARRAWAAASGRRER